MSALKINLVNPVEASEWNNELVSYGECTIFHSANWARLLADTYGYRPVYFTLSEQGLFKGCLPVMEVVSTFTGKRGVCLSFSDYCGSIVEGRDNFKLLFDSVLELGRISGWRYVEFRGENFLCNEMPRKIYAHHTIELSHDEELMLSRVRKSTARSIKKAVKEGVKVDICNSLQAVRDFYRLHCLTRRRHGLPPQPKSFFDKLHEHVISQRLGFTALARIGNVIVAGVVCLHFGRNAVYKYGASDVEFQYLRANNLVFWEMIKECARNGFDFCSLGRTDLRDEGLLVFKDGWGGMRTYMHYNRFDFVTNRFTRESDEHGRYYRNWFKKLPVNFLRILGDIGYRHMG